LNVGGHKEARIPEPWRLQLPLPSPCQFFLRMDVRRHTTLAEIRCDSFLIDMLLLLLLLFCCFVIDIAHTLLACLLFDTEMLRQKVARNTVQIASNSLLACKW
jgi:hypothetical protein